MSLGSTTVMTPPVPQAPPAPPNPPMFGSNSAAGQRQRSQASQAQGYGATVLGGGNPANTGQKTLLGQ